MKMKRELEVDCYPCLVGEENESSEMDVELLRSEIDDSIELG